MRRTLGFALMTALLCQLCGCGAAQDEEAFQRFRQESRESELCFEIELTALCGEESVSYSAAVRAGDGECELTLTAPETLRGVTLHTEDEGATLCYDGAVLSLGEREDDLSPAAAAPRLLSALSQGRLSAVWRESERLWGEVALEEDVSVRLCVDAESRLCGGELIKDGRTVVFYKIENWTKGEA